MVKVDGRTIWMTRGDTLALQVNLTKDGETYIPVEGDNMVFSVKSKKMSYAKKAFVDDEPLLTVNIPYDTRLLILQDDDTKNLDFGDYFYEIAIIFSDGSVDTFIPCIDADGAESILHILPEVL